MSQEKTPIELAFYEIEKVLNFIDERKLMPTKEIDDSVMVKLYQLENLVEKFCEQNSQRFPQAPMTDIQFRRFLRKLPPEIAAQQLKLLNMANALKERIRQMSTWIKQEAKKNETSPNINSAITAENTVFEEEKSIKKAPEKTVTPKKRKGKFKAFGEGKWKRL